MRRVVDNLLHNAVAHSPTGGTVRAAVRQAPFSVEIYVEDEGQGIPPAMRERVFEKYAQAELSRSGLSANRGLGLTFCRLAVESHGGRIWVESGHPGGARLRVSIPGAGLALSA
jgi:signal transduction histidine kinase